MRQLCYLPLHALTGLYHFRDALLPDEPDAVSAAGSQNSNKGLTVGLTPQ